jgi:hypothetical protein
VLRAWSRGGAAGRATACRDEVREAPLTRIRTRYAD